MNLKNAEKRHCPDDKWMVMVAFVAIFSVFVVCACVNDVDAISQGDEYDVDGIQYKVLSVNNPKVEVIGYSEDPVDLTIPETVDLDGNTMTVCGVHAEAFIGCSTLKSVSLPYTVRYIEDSVFENCANLLTVDLPPELDVIKEEAFLDCHSMTTINIGFVDTIYDHAFANCDHLQSIGSLSNVYEIGDYAFMNVGSSVMSSERITDFGPLTSTDTIGNYAFQGMPIMYLEIGSKLKTAGAGFCKGCVDLIEVRSLGPMTVLGDEAFSGCIGLKHIKFPDTLATVSETAFQDGVLKAGGLSGEHGISATAGNLKGCEFVGSGDGVLYRLGVGDIYSVDGLKYEITSTDPAEVALAGYEGSPENLSIGEAVDIHTKGFSVTSVGERAFESCTTLKSVTLPFMNEIESSAFSGCGALESVSLTAAATIGSKAFYQCVALETIELPDAEIIGIEAFSGCVALKSATMPSATTIKQKAFCDDRILNFVQFSADLSSIAIDAFYQDFYLNGSKVTGADSLKGTAFFGLGDGNLYSPVPIGYRATVSGLIFEVTDLDPSLVSLVGYEGSVSSISITGPVEIHGSLYTVGRVGEGAFSGCGTLESVDIPSAEIIESEAFSGCYQLSSINIPATKEVEDKAFNGCWFLASVELPAVDSIGDSAFYHCFGLKSLKIGSAAEIGDSAFSCCAGLESIDLSATTSIGSKAFEEVTVLKSVKFSANLQTIYDDSFTVGFYSGDSQLGMDAANLAGFTFNDLGDGKLRIVPAVGNRGSASGLIYEVTSIDPYEASIVGFEGDVPGVSITGPVELFGSEFTVVSVGEAAFSECSTLESVEISSAVSIAANAFYKCYALESAAFPAATTVGENAFYYCTKLATADFSAAKTIASSAFWTCKALETMSIPEAVSIGSASFYQCYALRTVSLDSVIEIPQSAFYHCDALESVYLPVAETIGTNAFRNDSALKSVSMPSVTTIGANAFYKDSALESVEFSKGLSFIDENAFSVEFYLDGAALSDVAPLKGRTFVGPGNGELYSPLPVGTRGTVSGLVYEIVSTDPLEVSLIGHEGDVSSILITGPVELFGREFSVVSVGDEALSGCTALESVEIASAVSIGKSAFSGCTALETAGFPAAKDVLESAFSGCGALASADIPAVENVYSKAFYQCHVLENVSDPSPSYVGSYAFYECYVLESMDLSGLEHVLDYSFDKCYALKVVSLDSAKSIGLFAFYKCYEIESVDLPLAEYVAEDAFGYCTSLKSVTLPSVQNLGGYSFEDILGLESVTFSKDLALVGENAFDVEFYDGDSKLLMNAVSLVGLAFTGSGDGQLYAALKVGDSFSCDGFLFEVTSVDPAEAALAGCEDGVTEYGIAEADYHGVAFAVTVFADDVLKGADSLVFIEIPATITSVGEGNLDSKMLRSITVGEGSKSYSSISGVLYDGDAKTLIKFPASKQRLVIPGSVEAIAAGAFQDAGAYLKSQNPDTISYFRYVSIPESVTSIGENAFAGSTLEVLKLLTTASVSDGAFAGCDSLDYVIFDRGLGAISDTAFDCTFLDESGSKVDFDADAMAGHKYTADTDGNLAVYVPAVNGTIRDDGLVYRITSNGDSKDVVAKGFDSGVSMTDVSIPAAVDYLGFRWAVTGVASKAFMGNTDIEKVACPANIGYKAFANCTSIDEIRLAGASVGCYAFFGCTSLSKATLEDTVLSIGTSAFSGCKNLEMINLEGVQTIAKHAFYGCALTTADLSVATSIGYGAFTGNDLQSVTFSQDLSDVDAKAFFRYAFQDADGTKLSVTAENLAGTAFAGQDKVLKATA